MGDDAAGQPSNAFPSTGWSCIAAMQNPADPGHVAARERFAQTYWKPIFYFLRVKRYPYHQADELTWDFLARFLEKDWVGKVDRGRGRFRNFLLKVLVRYVSDQGPRRDTRQRRLERGMVSMQALAGDAERVFEPAAADDPEDMFHKQLTAHLMAQVLTQLRLLYQEEGRQQWFDVYHAARWQDPGVAPPTQQALAEKFALTRDQVRYILEQTDKRCRRLLRAELRDHCGSEDEIDDEIRMMLA